MGQVSVCLPSPLQAVTAHDPGVFLQQDRQQERTQPSSLSFACHTLPAEPWPMSLAGFLVCLAWFFAPTVFLAWNSLLKLWLCVSCDPSLICHCQAGGALHWLCVACDYTALNPSIMAFATSHNDYLFRCLFSLNGGGFQCWCFKPADL